MKKALGDFQSAEGQGCFHFFEANEALQLWSQTGPTQMQIHQRPALREIAANPERIFRLDRDIEFPVAQRRLRKGKIGLGGGQLRPWRRPAGKTDRNQVDVLQELTIR